MNKHCSLTSMTLADSNKAISLISVRATDNNEPHFLGIMPRHGLCNAEVDGDSLIVTIPERGVVRCLLEGLPSWHSAWDNNQIEILILCGENYWEIESWDEFRLLFV